MMRSLWRAGDGRSLLLRRPCYWHAPTLMVCVFSILTACYQLRYQQYNRDHASRFSTMEGIDRMADVNMNWGTLTLIFRGQTRQQTDVALLLTVWRRLLHMYLDLERHLCAAWLCMIEPLSMSKSMWPRLARMKGDGEDVETGEWLTSS